MLIHRMVIRHHKVISSEILPKVKRSYYTTGSKNFMLTSAQPAAHYEHIDSKTSWQAQDNIDIQRVTQKAIIHELTQQQTKTIEDIVPWFLNNMPCSYFRSVPEQFRMDHIKALSAIQDANLDLHMNLKSHLPDGQLILTYIRPGKEAGRLLNLVKDLPWNFDSNDYRPLSRVQVFTSQDESTSLSMFVYGDKTAKPSDFNAQEVGGRILEYAKELQFGEHIMDEAAPVSSQMFEEEELINYFKKCDESYIMRSSPRRFLKQRELYEKVTGTECMSVSIEKSQLDAGDYWVDIAVANSIPQIALENASRVLYQHNYDVVRAHLDMISDGENGSVCMLRLLVSHMNEEDVSLELSQNKLIHELKRTKWLDPKTMDLVFNKFPWIGVTRGEVITAFCSLLHPIMSKKNQFAYSMGNIYDVITQERYIKHASSIADMFLQRFNLNDTLDDEGLERKSENLVNIIGNDVEDTVAKELLLKMVDIVKHALRTNVFLENRYSLGLRLDPKVMESEQDPRDIPYGIIFSHGRRFNAFHVRFRDIARGGLRLVTPSSQEQHALESARQYDECYNLAFAQQLKNKDIPEGGSKAVNLINCHGLSEQTKQFVMRKSVKAFSNTILDLVVDTEETQRNMIDYLGKKEVIYLGPDEQVTVDDIDWIVKRADKRGYDTPNAFMSSKPRTGINHKEYGVTSEGVNTYLDVALRQVLGINPKQDAFTVKITGGPDGDVAGNEIKILIREYGDNVKIVGISDASGCTEDPDGLNHEELIRLVDQGLCITHFEESKLGAHGEVFHCDNEEGINKRNSMHNRLIADAFIPAGGRPGTIDMSNYKKYLQDDGSASSPLIVEGANLFITGDARQALYNDAGVVIVKDSSANKCGVITSSFEIVAAMLLSEDEFYDNKEIIVEEVIEKLQKLAKMEAELLFKEFANHDGSLPDISEKISDTINTTTDTLIFALSQLPRHEIEGLLPLFREYLPKALSEIGFHNVQDRVPEQYIINALASQLASKIVYKEGCDYVNSLPQERMLEIARKYIVKEEEVAALKVKLCESDISEQDKQTILKILDEGGVRTCLNLNR